MNTKECNTWAIILRGDPSPTIPSVSCSHKPRSIILLAEERFNHSFQTIVLTTYIFLTILVTMLHSGKFSEITVGIKYLADENYKTRFFIWYIGYKLYWNSKLHTIDWHRLGVNIRICKPQINLTPLNKFSGTNMWINPLVCITQRKTMHWDVTVASGMTTIHEVYREIYLQC